jgi:hypothetical protein
MSEYCTYPRCVCEHLWACDVPASAVHDGSQRTHRWREPDSNLRSRSKFACMPSLARPCPLGAASRASAGRPCRPAFPLRRDRRFESGSLQPRVRVLNRLGPLQVENRGFRVGVRRSVSHSHGTGSPNPSDDAVLAQGRDCGSVKAEPIGKQCSGVLAQQRSRLDFGRDAIEAHRLSGHRHLALPMHHCL